MKIVITGASGGIGAAAARQLAAMGHDVVVVGRSPAKTRSVANAIGAPHLLADFHEMAQVRALADAIRAEHADLDVLVNNAGGIFGDRTLTADGNERTLQINHLAPFLLTNLLLPELRANGARVLNTSSVAHRALARFDIDDLDAERGYSPRTAYGNSKLMNVLFTRELHRREHEHGISTVAYHPGNVASNFAADSTSLLRLVYTTFLRRLFLVDVERGADNTVWLANGTPGRDWRSGEYYVKRSPGRTSRLADDPQLARRLWELSARRVGVPDAAPDPR